MLGTGWTEVVALLAAFVIAVIASPAGISGAVLLLPFQVGVLGTPSPAVTPTNLLYNVVAIPGAIYRYWRPAHPSPHIREPARRSHRLDNPRGTAPRRAGFRPGSRCRADSPGRVARCVPARSPGQARQVGQ